MDLSGIPKLGYRSRWMHAYRKLSGNSFISRDEIIFTLGGDSEENNGEMAIDSELDQLTSTRFDGTDRFILPQQYVSVERKKEIHLRNKKIPGCIWILGSISEAFKNWKGSPCAIIHADMMCGVDKGLETIFAILDTSLQKRVPRCGKTLFVFNLMVGSLFRENMGAKFNQEVRGTIENNPIFKRIAQEYTVSKQSLTIVDNFRYKNKALSHNSAEMETVMYWG